MTAFLADGKGVSSFHSTSTSRSSSYHASATAKPAAKVAAPTVKTVVITRYSNGFSSPRSLYTYGSPYHHYSFTRHYPSYVPYSSYHPVFYTSHPYFYAGSPVYWTSVGAGNRYGYELEKPDTAYVVAPYNHPNELPITSHKWVGIAVASVIAIVAVLIILQCLGYGIFDID